MPDLRITDLAVQRGDRIVFRHFSATLAAGDIIHLQGRNGAGKTTLLETLAGLRLPAEGTIGHLPEPQHRHWLGHRNGLNPALTALENLQFWCALNAERSEGVPAALEQLGVKPQSHRPVGSLSTGQRRRVALARLLAVRRPWWFLDEPLAGIDADGLQLIADLLAQHAQTGGTTLITSHQPLPASLPRLRVLALKS